MFTECLLEFPKESKITNIFIRHHMDRWSNIDWCEYTWWKRYCFRAQIMPATYTWNFGSISLDSNRVPKLQSATTISLHGSLAAIREDVWDDLLKHKAVVVIWFCLKGEDSMVAWNIYIHSNSYICLCDTIFYIQVHIHTHTPQQMVGAPKAIYILLRKTSTVSPSGIQYLHEVQW